MSSFWIFFKKEQYKINPQIVEKCVDKIQQKKTHIKNHMCYLFKFSIISRSQFGLILIRSGYM